MRFSIIIPVYNVAAYLQDCLDSVLGQSFADFEAICVNDGSTDNSLDILKEYQAKDARIKVVSQTNQGTSVARNVGIGVAQGDYLFFLDADDWIVPTALQILSEHLGGEDMLCFGGQRYFENRNVYDSSDCIRGGVWRTGWEYYNRYALQHWQFAFVCVVLRIYKRNFILNNRFYFDKDITHEDNLWVPQVCYYAQQTRQIPDILYIYRIRDNSKMQDVSLSRRADIIKVANQLGAFFQDKAVEKTTLYRALTHHYQSAFAAAGRKEDKVLISLVNWSLYHKVSRTKMRHRVQYLMLRISPALFRLVNKHF